MKTYSLSTLMKVREQKKAHADLEVRMAQNQLQLEERRLNDLQSFLSELIDTRNQQQRNFFSKARSCPVNKREITCHFSSHQKNIADETKARLSLKEQEEVVKHREISLEIAKSSALAAHKNLRLIEKHFVSWQHKLLRDEDLKQEYLNDDHNGVRYITKA